MSSVPGGTAPPCPGSTAGWGSRTAPQHTLFWAGVGDQLPAAPPASTTNRTSRQSTRHSLLPPDRVPMRQTAPQGPSERCSDAGITPSTYPRSHGAARVWDHNQRLLWGQARLCRGCQGTPALAGLVASLASPDCTRRARVTPWPPARPVWRAGTPGEALAFWRSFAFQLAKEIT